MHIFLLLAGLLALTLFFGRFIEKIRIPWVFAALFIGLIISLKNPFTEITSSETFGFLSDLGIYFLLFIIGLEIDLKKIKKQNKFISGLSISLVLAESLLGSLFIHYIFDLSWMISILTASSFATVGEAILVPILDEFKLIKTKFGQILLGVGVFDDIFELITIVAASFLLGYSSNTSGISIGLNLFLLGLLFLIPLFLQVFQKQIPHLKFQQVPFLFLFGLLVLFTFVGIGDFVESAALGAIFAGLALKNLLSDDKIAQFDSIVRVIAYGLFVPIFFLKVGMEVDLRYLFTAPLLILAVLFITDSSKVLISYLMGRKKLGPRKSILLGIGLSAKFSTSIVIITMLYGKNIIPLELYSVLIGSMIASKFIIPVAFSVLLKKWNLEFKRTGHA